MDPGVFLARMVAEDVVCPHLMAGKRWSNLSVDVLLVPLWMLRKVGSTESKFGRWLGGSTSSREDVVLW